MSDLQRRTEAHLKNLGYLTASVERRKRFPDTKSRKCNACGSVKMIDIAVDLFNVFDLIAIRPKLDFVFVQVTSSANHAARRNKIIASSEAKLCILAGARILIQSWAKVQHRWMPKDEWINLSQFVFGLPDSVEQFYEDERRRKMPDLPPGATLPLSDLSDDANPF